MRSFFRGFIKLSTDEMPCGQIGVEVLYSIPKVPKYLLMSLPLKGGPLSDFTSLAGHVCQILYPVLVLLPVLM